MRMLDLFAGIGGASVAGDRLGIKTTAFVEIDKNAQKVLRANYPHTPIHDDVRTYKPIIGDNDIVWSSFPCTGTSIAGQREGLSHSASSLWREGFRCFLESGAKYSVIEQPTGVIRNGLRAILGAYLMAGCSSILIEVTARAVGAGHKRARLFIVSYYDEQPVVKTCGTDQMRSMVQDTRSGAIWLNVKRSCYGNDHEFSPCVDGLLVPRGTKGRIKSRFLLGRVVCPAQAEIPLKYIQQLEARI